MSDRHKNSLERSKALIAERVGGLVDLPDHALRLVSRHT